ncbi:MAG TPA: hypothetical protein VMI56_04910 [Reyranella sp.]|nr:hypothetical protein [Reyranella sp.]
MTLPALEGRAGRQAALAFLLSLLFLCGLIAWLQNVHIFTLNGMYKSIQAEPWISDFRHARLDPSNYLYFPLYGALAKLLDTLGILRGVAWKQFAYLNAFWASLASAFVYLFVRRVTASALVATLATLFHLGCGFVLLLAVINEDIMPAYAVLLASMLMAAAWFDRPTWARVVLVAIVFTLGWLIEWRLIFPTLPALMLALALAPVPLGRRAALIATLLVAIVAMTGIVQQVWEGHNGAMGLPDLLWTGKGVDTGWAGLSWDKAWMMLAGVGNYLLIVGDFLDPATVKQHVLPLSVPVLLQLAIFVVAVILLWPRRNDPRVRAIAIVFLGTLGAGQVMNIYSQPQDPQMQLNVMSWLTLAWALLVAALMARRQRALTIALVVLSLLPIAWNVASLSRWRGGDRDALAALANIEGHFPAERTVFVYFGFEPINVWQYALWSHTWDWDSGVNDARFKWIAIDSGAIRHPHWTPEEDAQSIKRQIDTALNKGYRVAIAGFWDWSAEELASHLASVSGANRAPAIYDMLHRDYRVQPAFVDPTTGPYFELFRRTP